MTTWVMYQCPTCSRKTSQRKDVKVLCMKSRNASHKGEVRVMKEVRNAG